jgi:bifunctional DNA-binding transcriptional regulator/antitoxin component of YhaV-PrlF toxin-antitoxin module
MPARLRRKFGIEQGRLVIAEEREDAERAEFLLPNAIDEEGYQAACKTVREMGVDPDEIEHFRP